MGERRIVIVGGVAGGMSAAARLRRLDERATITVLERGPHVSFANCGLPYYVGGEIADEASLVLQTPESLRSAFNLDVRVRHEAVGLDAAARTVRVRADGREFDLPYDELILSPGAVAARPPVDGLDHPRVNTLRTIDDAVALRGLADPGAAAVVLGAGFIGVEAAESLRARGLEVAVVELADQVLPPLERELAWLVGEELRRLGVEVRTGVAARAVSDSEGRAVVHLSDGGTLPADLVVLSVGVRPDTAAFEAAGVACERGAIVVDEHGRTNLSHVWAVGDATLSRDAVTDARRPVALAGPANRAGRLVADAIASSAPRAVPRPLGTAIVRVGELAVAMTGANRAGLEAAGRPFTTIHVHPVQHAGWFPGAKQLHLVVHLDPKTGALLGAQGAGPDGVDKRIDVIATAIRAGLSAPDLADLDLCYSPPYGSARDAVTMVGLVADNVVTGQLRLWQSGDLDRARREDFLLDVRTPAEFATGHLPGAVNIPHTQLRGRVDEVRESAGERQVAVLCQSGVRSYIAHRVLTAAGIRSASLSGGMLTLRAWLGEAAAETFQTVEGER